MGDILTLTQKALKDIDESASSIELESLRLQYLGKKGSISLLLQSIGAMPLQKRGQFGSDVNVAKNKISTQIQEKSKLIKEQLLEKKLQSEVLDLTLPGRKHNKGSLHPVTLTLNRINDFFISLGFEKVKGDEIEDEYHNFEALNIPKSHPARAMHDTFYFPDGRLLRTHTSSAQIHQMENNEPPHQVISPGRVYRCDSDLTHTPMFHQVEGLWIDKKITFANLLANLELFLKTFFEDEDLKIRARPSYFPFTEPSAEIDICCVMCEGEGCRVCSGSGWIEVLGCGMVHPNVLKMMKIDNNKYQGYAFGLGVERLAMLYYGISDLRLFFENDLRFLRQF
ncbi:MAG: phenylalanine--tRNA ligase subunit alpha [Gammaproteobacteria bacterium]|nr:MAG: phenylalanine--tRNA ligase subunit alpha [Gammaproteobacteria bacterium]